MAKEIESEDSPNPAGGPDLLVYADESSVDGERLRQLGMRALLECRKAAKKEDSPILTLAEIEVTLVTDEQIAVVHGEFLNDPTPTDVITFHHGEILISTDTAERQSKESGLAIADEVLLYLIHGLLHLGDWDDHEPAEAAEMAVLQDCILKKMLLSPADGSS